MSNSYTNSQSWYREYCFVILLRACQLEKENLSFVSVSRFWLYISTALIIQKIPHEDQSFFVVLIFQPDRPENKNWTTLPLDRKFSI